MKINNLSNWFEVIRITFACALTLSNQPITVIMVESLPVCG